MSRWGKKLYQSDSSLDFFATIPDRIIREITFWTAPEQVEYNTKWITEFIAVIEVILLFDVHQVGFNSYLRDQVEAVKRWRNIFFTVWDAEWMQEEHPYATGIPYRTYEYRIAHRHIMNKWLDRIEAIAMDWSQKEPQGLPPFMPVENLPYFSMKDDDGKHLKLPGQIVVQLTEQLTHTIVFILSDENHEYAVDFFQIEDVWVAADVLGRLCEAYNLSPDVTEQTVDNWLEKSLAIWKEGNAEEQVEWDKDDDELYKMSLPVFERLKDVARKYPPLF